MKPLIVLGLVTAATWMIAPGHVVAQQLYDPARHAPLVADHRAARVGDVLTVLVVEASRAESRAGSSADRRFEVEAGVDYPAGGADVGASLQRGNRDQGLTSRHGELRAQLSAKVTQVLANGDLRVAGEQLITVNGERQRIALVGTVRPLDIAADNTVLSTRLADVDIQYHGRGFVNDSQRPGLITRFLNLFRL